MTVGAQTTSGGARLVSVIEQLVAAMGGKGAVEGAETAHAAPFRYLKAAAGL
jgi:hypothetical protein